MFFRRKRFKKRLKQDKYVEAVTYILSQYFTFRYESEFLMLRKTIEWAIDNSLPFEFILDEPVLANWRLKYDPKFYVRVSSYHYIFSSKVKADLEELNQQIVKAYYKWMV